MRAIFLMFDSPDLKALESYGGTAHLISDHYFEDAGWTYHPRYSSFDFIRGQEADKWQAMVRPTLERLRERYHPLQIDEDRKGLRLQNLLNREAVRDENDFPAVRRFEQATAFFDENRANDDSFLQIETLPG